MSVPALVMSDFPLVAAYVSDSLGDWVQMNLTVYDPATGLAILFETAILNDGSVTLYSAQVGSPYRIVVVT